MTNSIIVIVTYTCPPNNTLYNNLCYGPGPNNGYRDFDRAISDCYGDGQGNLTKLDHPTKMAIATTNLATNRQYWIGLKDIYHQNNASGFRWIIDDSVASGFSKWAPSQPGGSLEDCVYIKYYDDDWYWYTQECDENARVLCQRSNLTLIFKFLSKFIE